jgi:Na+/H+ antiporter NhaD/arsenite permease-like protein
VRNRQQLIKFAFLIGSCLSLLCLSSHAQFTLPQSISLTIFAASVVATLLFWESRVAIAFWGIAALILTKTVDIEHLVIFASLEVILFLVGMMVIMGLLREVNFFNWILCRFVTLKGMSGAKLAIIICVSSAFMACLVDEVTSIIFMVALVFSLAEIYEVNAGPFIIMAVMSTNIGSTGTVLGNPIGILIATKAGLTFEDFLLRAFPLMVVVLLTMIGVVLVWYRRAIWDLDTKVKQMGSSREALATLVCLPMTKEIRKEMIIFFATLISIALHHRLEAVFRLPTNSLLLSIPLLSAGLIMLWRQDRAKAYIEKDVDWWTLIFFMLLFAKVGALKYTGVTNIFSREIAGLAKGSQLYLLTFILWVSTIGSSILDNVVLVATFIPVISELKAMGINTAELWWALLFGGCLGGNITMVGSTSNIVALGMLEKGNHPRITFFQWLKIGSVIGFLTTGIAWAVLILFRPFFEM